MEYGHQSDLAARQATLGAIANASNRSTALELGEGLFGQLNKRMTGANAELSRIAATLEQAADRVFGSQPKPVSDPQADRREPYSAADALNSAADQTHRLILEIDTQVQRLLGGF